MIGQALPPTQGGVQALSGPQGQPARPTVDPTGSTIISQGSRMSSLVSPITAKVQAGAVTFYWDGTNNSQQLTVRRDDGTKYGPSLVGSPIIVTGLTPGATYWFYFYFDEATQLLKQVADPNTAAGAPPIAFPAVSLDAAQQQILKGHIQAAPVFSSVGIAIPTIIGTTFVQGGIGGGGGGWGH